MKKSIWETLPLYLMVFVTIVYAIVTWKMLGELRTANEPIISITTGKTNVVKPEKPEEYWIVEHFITNKGNSIARQLKFHIWFDNSVTNTLDFNKIQFDGPFSLAPDGIIAEPKEITKAVITQDHNKDKEVIKHAFVTYLNDRGIKYKSEITEKLKIDGTVVSWELISLIVGEVIE